MTFLGVIFIPAALICFFWRPFYLVPLLILSSVFEAGSVLNGELLGNFEFGISPFYFIEVLIFVRLVISFFGPFKVFPSKISPMRGILVLLCTFWVWCVASAFVLPYLFAGTLVSVPREMGTQEFSPLQWTLSNLAQAGYLTLNVGAVLYALHEIRTRLRLEQLLRAFFWAVFLVVAIGLAQFVASETALEFPYELFNSNPTYAQGTGQEIGDVHRVNSTFTEPSTAGSFLAAASCGLLAGFLSGKRNFGFSVALMATITALILTTSTTGFAAFGAGICLLAIFFNTFRKRKRERKSSKKFWIWALILLAIVTSVLIWTPDLLDALMAVTIDKIDSYSFWARMATELHSMQVFFETYGVGVGLGSNRSSGLLPTMLSSVGIVGTTLFFWFLYRVGKSSRGTSSNTSFQVAFWAFITILIGEIAAVPDLNRPALWALLLLVLAYLNVLLTTPPSAEPALQPGMLRPHTPYPVSA